MPEYLPLADDSHTRVRWGGPRAGSGVNSHCLTRQRTDAGLELHQKYFLQ